MTEWTNEDSRRANVEGWDLFDCDGSKNGPLQLCRIDDPEMWRADRKVTVAMEWEDDTEVWDHVRQLETRLHLKALEVVKEQNRPEFERIMGWRS